MIKVTRLIETTGTELFKEFLQSEFNFSLLVGENAYFDCWREKNMGHWIKYVNDDNIVLEVYSETYKIKKPKQTTSIEIIIPKTINDFIEDMHKYGVDVYWDNIIDDMFEPKDYLNKHEIKNYYKNLLEKLDKSKEIT